MQRKAEKITCCIHLQLKATKSSSNSKYKFWEHKNHPVLLDSTEMYNKRVNYLHWNPSTAGFVAEPWHWIYSSATDYFADKRGCYIFLFWMVFKFVD